MSAVLLWIQGNEETLREGSVPNDIRYFKLDLSAAHAVIIKKSLGRYQKPNFFPRLKSELARLWLKNNFN